MNEEIKCYPVGEIPAKSFVDLMTIDWKLICTINNLKEKESLSKEELLIKKECIVWDEEGCPDIYVNGIIDLHTIKNAFILLERETHKKYKFINENLVEKL